MGTRANDEEPKKALATLRAMQSVLAEDSGRAWLHIPRSVLQSIVGVALFLGLWHYFAPTRAEYAKLKRHDAESATQTAMLATAQTENVSELAKRYDAITDWRRHLGNKTAFDTIYSAELAAVLVSPERHPTLFIAELQDVGQSEGNYVLLFDGFVNFRTHFLLQVSCSDEQAQRIMSAPREKDNRFAVVIEIASVDSEVGRIPAADGASSRSHPAIPVKGNLVDFRFLGSYRGDLLEILSAFKKV